LAFGELLRSLWSTDGKPVAPHHFKSKIGCFSPQFSGFNQHDSQELLAFLLDGLHEDLNQVKCKPYEEAKDASDRLDEEVADEYWSNHLARNDSVIVDTCHVSHIPTFLTLHILKQWHRSSFVSFCVSLFHILEIDPLFLHNGRNCPYFVPKAFLADLFNNEGQD
jgi:hypothetical protein